MSLMNECPNCGESMIFVDGFGYECINCGYQDRMVNYYE